MKKIFNASGPWVRAIVVLNSALITLFAAIYLLFSWQSPTSLRAQEGDGTAYIPLQMAPEPTATPGPPPQFVKNVPLPKAQCPNYAGFNHVTGLMYVPSVYSDSVSIFNQREYEGDIFAGEWPREVISDPNSARTWVSAMHTGTTLLEGKSQIGLVPRSYEPFAMVFNPVNGFVYITDLNSKVQVIDGANLVKTIDMEDPVTGGRSGWILSIVVDPQTGLVYVASWEYGSLFVIEGTEIITSIHLGSKPVSMAFDSERSLIYVAHAEPNSLDPHDISVVDVKTLSVTKIVSTPGKLIPAQDVAVDSRSGLTYVSNPTVDTVTVLDGKKVVNKIRVGDEPWDVGVNPNDGYVFVTNRRSDDVSILLNGTLMDTVKVQGEDPFAVGFDTNENDIYIINRGNKIHTKECKNGSVTILH